MITGPAVPGRGSRQHTLVPAVVSFEPMSFSRSKMRKVSNCPLFSAENMTWNVSWQVPPSPRCSREKGKGKITRCTPGEVSFLTPQWLDQFIIRHESRAGWGWDFTQLTLIHSSEGSVALREMENDGEGRDGVGS